MEKKKKVNKRADLDLEIRKLSRTLMKGDDISNYTCHCPHNGSRY